MNKYEMGCAGYIMNQMSWTDEELKKIIEANEIILEYFKARGEYFGIITSLLTKEREQLKEFQEARK